MVVEGPKPHNVSVATDDGDVWARKISLDQVKATRRNAGVIVYLRKRKMFFVYCKLILVLWQKEPTLTVSAVLLVC